MNTNRLFLALALAAGQACAGPAEDALARTSELQRAAQAQAERLSKLESTVQSQALLSLLNQVESLKSEVARLRGSNEELLQQFAVSDKRIKDLYADLDARIKELASRPAPSAEVMRLQPSPNLITSPAPQADSEAEARAYEAVQALVKTGKYKEAVAGFQAFLKQYPNAGLAANALYWTGFSHVAISDFKSAAASYQQLIKDFPGSAKAPDAMYSLARAQTQMNEGDAARATLEQLIVKYPASKAAENAKKLLATLKAP